MALLVSFKNVVQKVASTPRRLSCCILLCCGFFELGAFGHNLFFNSGVPLVARPTVEAPFIPMQLSFNSFGPKAPKPVLERLFDSAHRLAQKTQVPYVFGGSQLGSSKRCQECSECIRHRRLPANSTMDRFNQCGACRDCGLDCSNFVNRLFSESGIDVRFASTSTLHREGDLALEERYGFVNIGDDLTDARPGDILLKKGHVVMLMEIHPFLGTLDFIHASRGSKRTPVGGIELRRGMRIAKMQREVVKILRHRDLILPEDAKLNMASAKYLWKKFRWMTAAK